MPRYLSQEWLDAAREAVAATDPADGDPLVVQHVVEGGPEGDVAYHVALGDGAPVLETGDAPHADVTFRQSYATAAGVARGERSAKEAFLAGEVRVSGNVTRLLGRQDLFAAVDRALAPLRGETTY